MSSYTNLENEIVRAARNSMIARKTLLEKLKTQKHAGAESWFQWEFIYSPWSEKWNFKKRQTPYDLDVLDDNDNLLIKIEIKCCTDGNFNWVTRYLNPTKGTKNKSKEQLMSERSDVSVLFLAHKDVRKYFTTLIPSIFVLPPLWEPIGIDPDWIVGLIKLQ